MNDLGRIASANVAITADLTALATAIQGAVREAQAAGEKIGSGLASGLSNTQYIQDATGRWHDQFGQFVSEAEATGKKAGQGLGEGFSEGINSNAGTVTTSLQAMAARAGEFLKDFGSTFKSLGTELSIGITAPLVLLAKAAVDSFGELDSLKRGLVAVTGSAAEAQKQFTELLAVAKLPGLGMQEAVHGAVNLEAFGFSASQAKDILLGFGNALASVGKGRAELDRVILQLGQMAGAGRVLISDLRPIIQTVPQVATIIKQNFGPEALSSPQQALDKLGVSTDQFIAILVDGLKQLPQVTGGLKNSIENFSDSMTIALAKLGQTLEPFVSGFLDTVGSALTSLVDAFTSLPGPIQNATVVVAAFAAAIGPILLVMGGLASALSNVLSVVGLLSNAFAAFQAGTIAAEFTAMSTASAGLATVLTALEVAAVAIPWVAIAAGVGILVASLWEAEDATNKTTLAMKNLGETGTLATAQWKQSVESAREFTRVMEGATRSVQEFRDQQFRGGNVGDWATTMRGFADATTQAASAIPPLSKNTQDLIAKQDELRAKVNTLKQTVKELTDAQKSGLDVTTALAIAKRDLAKAESDLTPMTRTQTAEVKKNTAELKAMAEAAHGLTGKLGELYAAQTAGVGTWGQLGGQVLATLDKMNLAQLKVDQATAAWKSNLQDLAIKAAPVFDTLALRHQIMVDSIVKGFQNQQAEIDKTNAQYQKYGVVSVAALQAEHKELTQNLELAQKQGKGLFEVVQWKKQILENEIQQLAISTDISLSEKDRNAAILDRKEQLNQVNEQLDSMNEKTKQGINYTKEWDRVWQQTFNTLADGISGAITGANSWHDVWKNVLSSVRDMVVNLVVRAFLVDLGNALKGTAQQVTELEKLFGSLTDKIGGAIGTKGGGGKAASGIAGASASTIGVIGIFTQALGDIVQGFQLARIEGTLNAIEQGVRSSALFLGGRGDQGILGILFKINEEIAWGANTKATEEIRDILASGITIAGESGSGSGADSGSRRAGRSGPESTNDAGGVDAATVARMQATAATEAQQKSQQDLATTTSTTTTAVNNFGSSVSDLGATVGETTKTFDINTASVEELNARYDELKATGQGTSAEAQNIQARLAALRDEAARTAITIGQQQQATNAAGQSALWFVGPASAFTSSVSSMTSAVSTAANQTRAVLKDLADGIANVTTAAVTSTNKTRAALNDLPSATTSQTTSSGSGKQGAASLEPFKAPTILNGPIGPGFAELAAGAETKNLQARGYAAQPIQVNINGGTFSSSKFVEEVATGLIGAVRLQGANLS